MLKDTNFNFKNVRGSWEDVYSACLNTIGKDTNNIPSELWKRRILISEHSPIRKLSYSGKWRDLPYFVSTHFVRHKHGIEHFVSTQRTDRTKFDRNLLPQNSPVSHEIDVNAQAIINISRKRLCFCASLETREAWQMFLNELKKVEPELVKCCVKECIYRGFCPEFYSCGYASNKNSYLNFREELDNYRNGMNNYGSIEQINLEYMYLRRARNPKDK